MGEQADKHTTGKGYNMEKVFRNYLDMETSYALLMNGPRGVGKTFFIKKSVQPLIKTIPVHYDQSKKYIPVYISLFGIKTMDEVYAALAMEIIPILKRKKVKIGLSIAKLVSRGLLSYYRGGDIDLYKRDLLAITKNTIETKDFVLIFDDLDRISSLLEVGEVIGFINSLVEHDNNKIIIIGDDDQFKGDNNYTAVKEKTIGTVIEYATEMADNFDLIIASKYQSSSKALYEYLVRSKEEILFFFSAGQTKSLRTLIYFLEHFYYIFGELYIALKLENEVNSKLGFQKMDAVLRFSLAISIEFKKGTVNFQNPRGIEDMKELNLILSKRSIKNDLRDNNPSKTGPTREPEKSFRERFIDTYFDNDYEFYLPVYNFLTGGDAFEIEPLLSDLKACFDDRIFTPTRQDTVYKKLSDPQVYDLSSKEYINLSDELFAFAKEGKYPLEKYIPILFYLSRFPEIKSYPMEDVASQLVTAIHQNAKQFPYDDVLKSKFDSSEERKDKKHYIDVFNVANEVNNSNRLNEIEQNKADLFLDFRDQPDQFYLKANELSEVQLFAHWDFKAFYDHFKTMPASEIPKFKRFLEKRYEYPIRERLEYNFICSLMNELVKAETEITMLRRVAEKQLIEVLKDIIKRSPAFSESST